MRQSAGGVTGGLDVDKHAKFWARHLAMLPGPYLSGDDQRMTLAYFCLGGLDLLAQREKMVGEEQSAQAIDWVYAQQIPSQYGGGFRGSPAVSERIRFADGSEQGGGHLTMTYTALLNLGILRDDYTRLDRAALRQHVRGLQQPDGSFLAAHGQLDCDVRFTYCAFAIAYMLADWDILDLDAAVSFLLHCRRFDGAFAQRPEQESHGGSTYCVVAALCLAGRLHILTEPERTVRWLLARQQNGGGFQGRIEKEQDVCYSFWCGAALHLTDQILGSHESVDAAADAAWILSAQSPIGGIAKTPGQPPDVLHSYLGYVALSLDAHDGDLSIPLAPVSVALNVARDTAVWIQSRLWTAEHRPADAPRALEACPP